MNEVTKLYENAEVLMQDCLRKYYCVFDKSNKNCIVSEKCKIKDCAYLDDNSFTAEKQIELVKFLMEQEDFSWTIARQGKDTEYAFYVGYEHSSGGFKEFTEALAGIINDLWQDLTKEECKQIKNILESEVRE